MTKSQVFNIFLLLSLWIPVLPVPPGHNVDPSARTCTTLDRKKCNFLVSFPPKTNDPVFFIQQIGRLRKPRRQWHGYVAKLNKGLMSRTAMALHLRYNSWYISLPCSAKQKRAIDKFCCQFENVNHDSYFFFNFYKFQIYRYVPNWVSFWP